METEIINELKEITAVLRDIADAVTSLKAPEPIPEEEDTEAFNESVIDRLSAMSGIKYTSPE